ncbi:MAG: hypothetical protein ACKOZM_08565 [Flavobacteriales bacterium]
MASHRALRFMPRIVYGSLILVWIISWAYTKLVWGSTSVLMRSAMTDSLLDNVVYQLYYQPPIFSWIYYAHLLLCVWSLWNTRLVFIARLFAWFTGIMIYQTAPGIFGASIFVLLNAALILFPVYYECKSGFRRWLNSMSMLALRLQTLVVMITVALFMWGSAQWKDGEALYYLFHQPAIVREFATDFAMNNSFVLRVITWTVFLFAVVLPLALIVRHTRYYGALSLILAGILSMFIFQHIVIGMALALLALPWIDARSSYGLTSAHQ